MIILSFVLFLFFPPKSNTNVKYSLKQHSSPSYSISGFIPHVQSLSDFFCIIQKVMNTQISRSGRRSKSKGYYPVILPVSKSSNIDIKVFIDSGLKLQSYQRKIAECTSVGVHQSVCLTIDFKSKMEKQMTSKNTC